MVSDSFANTLARTLNTVFADALLRKHLPVNPLQLMSRSAMTTPVDARSNSESDSDLDSESNNSRGNMDVNCDQPDVVPNEPDFLQSVFDGPNLLQHHGSYPDDNGSDSDSESTSESGSSTGEMDVDHDERDIVPNHSDDGQSGGPSLLAGAAKTVFDGVLVPKKSSHLKNPRPSTKHRSAGTTKQPRGSHSDDAQSDCLSLPTGTVDGGDLAPTQSSTNKCRRSPSPVVLRGLGTKENPIELDKVASLFEPMAI